MLSFSVLQLCGISGSLRVTGKRGQAALGIVRVGLWMKIFTCPNWYGFGSGVVLRALYLAVTTTAEAQYQACDAGEHHHVLTSLHTNSRAQKKWWCPKKEASRKGKYCRRMVFPCKSDVFLCSAELLLGNGNACSLAYRVRKTDVEQAPGRKQHSAERWGACSIYPSVSFDHQVVRLKFLANTY